MNRINENLNFYSSYFHGVQDIIEFKSAKQAAIGVLKIISGLTLVVPIIFAAGYYTSKHELHNLESLCGRVSKALKSIDNIEKPTQNDLIQFISKNVLDQDENQDLEAAAFQRLEPTSQKIFFNSMANKGMLVAALAHVPKDIREIHIGFGRNPSREMIDEAITQLSTFDQLHTITFDLSQTVYYTKGIESLFELSINTINLSSLFAYSSEQSFELGRDSYNTGGVIISNNSLPASRLIHGVVYSLIKKNALARVNFNFKLKPGELNAVYIANPSRMARIPKEDADHAAKSNPLNYMRPFPDAKDIWFAKTGNGFYYPK